MKGDAVKSDAVKGGRPVRWVALPVEPGRFWIRHRPQPWPTATRPWTDLARGTIELPSRRSAGSADEGRELDFPPQRPAGLLYLPPADAALDASRSAWAEGSAADGASLLVQCSVGAENPPPEPSAGLTMVWDPLAALLGEEPWTWPSSSSSDGIAVWPLIPGLSTDPEGWEGHFEALRAAGFSVVQPVVPELTPVERRTLAEGLGDDVFEELFHGPRPDDRAFSRAAACHGLAPFVGRPQAVGTSIRVQSNARLAERLALAAELWLRLGRSDPQGQALFRAARWADETSYDVAALAREGNLTVVEAVDAQSVELIIAAVAQETDLAARLLAEYLGTE